MATELEIRVEDGPTRVVRLVGELDVDSARRCASALEQAVSEGSTVIVLDLTALTFCDSSGVRTLLSLQRGAADAGRELRVRGVDGPVAEVLRLTGVDRVLRAADGDEAP